MTAETAVRGVRVRILGPLRVEALNQPVAIGGPKARVLLARLLVAGGEVVPTDRLVEDGGGSTRHRRR